MSTTTTKHPFAPKLDFATAELIRARYREGDAPRALAREFGVAPSSIYEVVNGRSHRPLLMVRLRPGDLERLETSAHELGVSPAEFAARCLERELTAQARP